MSLVILDGMETESEITEVLKMISKQFDKECSHFKLKDMHLLPCRGCCACGIKSPGQCVFTDDMPKIMKSVAQCSFLIMLTPIRFGGFSSLLKKAVDKLALGAVLPLYTVKEGRLLHPSRYGNKTLLLGVGVNEGNTDEQEKSFQTLVANNALNMHYPHKTLIFRRNDGLSTIETGLMDVFKEAN